MVNKIRKGRRTMQKARKLAESKGYLVWQVPHTRRTKDIFNKFDQIWLKKSGELYWVQVKTNQRSSREQRKLMKEFAKDYKQKILEIVWYDRKGFKIWYKK